MGIERRIHPRVTVGPAFTASLSVGGRRLEGVRVANVSVGGCFLMVAAPVLPPIASGTPIERFVFAAPGVPDVPVDATVRHVLDDGGGWVGVGVQFGEMPPRLHVALEVIVAEGGS